MKKIIKKPELTYVSWSEYWQRQIAEKSIPLTSRKSPCDSCPVVDGFYKEYSDRLKDENAATKLKACKRWFCHVDRNRSCKGNWDNVWRVK